MEQERKSDGARQTSELLKQWFDRLEVTLRHEAELAGLLEHGTLTGAAREFFVSRMLRTILPPSVHVGTGRVIGHEGMSKQIDVVLYDPRCPLLEIQPGVGLYFVEGVIATMEVKSKLTADKLRDALENCRSVSKQGWTVRGRGEVLDAQLQRIMQTKKLPEKCVRDAINWTLVPRSYVFSFTTDMSTESICDTVLNWYEANCKDHTGFFPSLPAIIATLGTIGLLSDEWLTIDPGADIREEMRRENGDLAMVLMGLWSTTKQFGWLAIRLLHDVHRRLGLPHLMTGASLTIEDYLPVDGYFDEECLGRTGHYITWDGKVSAETVGQANSEDSQ